MLRICKEVNVADRCRRLCRQLTQIRWTIYWGRTKQSHQLLKGSLSDRNREVCATFRLQTCFCFTVLYLGPTASVIVSINFSKMELKIKDNKFVSVNSGKGKKPNNLLWSPPPRITKSCHHRHHFWLHDWLLSADNLAFAPVWFLKECDRRISCLSAVEASQTKLWQL